MGEEIDKDIRVGYNLIHKGEMFMNNIVDKEIEEMGSNVLLTDKPLTSYEKKYVLNEMLKEMQQKLFDINSRTGILYNNCKEAQKYIREQNRRDLKLISRKRFKKLLCSVGYDRKTIEKIIGVEYKSKGRYDLDDFMYWRSEIEEEHKNK